VELVVGAVRAASTCARSPINPPILLSWFRAQQKLDALAEHGDKIQFQMRVL
jgi:hypothetical protein